MKVDGQDVETPVSGALIVRKHHLSFDPDEDLTPGSIYGLYLSDGIEDLNGEPLDDVTFELTPEEVLKLSMCWTVR